MTDQEFAARARQLCQSRPAPAPPAAAVADGMINLVAAAAERGADPATEYLAEDGLLHCKVCHGKRQTIVTPPFEGAKPRTVRCWCDCPTEQDKLRERERRWKEETARSVCFKGAEKYSGWTFDKDDGRQPDLMAAAAEYAEQFQDHLRDGKGLLLYGPVGTGKSVAAACIANAVLAKGYRPKMTNISTVADELWAAEDKAAYLRHLAKYDLLILDDLGTERKTEYMQEMAYKVINARYAEGGPVIVTTNLTKEELGSPAEMWNKRIYSRILEHCLAINVDGNDRRMQAAGANKVKMRKQLGLEV